MSPIFAEVGRFKATPLWLWQTAMRSLPEILPFCLRAPRCDVMS